MQGFEKKKYDYLFLGIVYVKKKQYFCSGFLNEEDDEAFCTSIYRDAGVRRNVCAGSERF